MAVHSDGVLGIAVPLPCLAEQVGTAQGRDGPGRQVGETGPDPGGIRPPSTEEEPMDRRDVPAPAQPYARLDEPTGGIARPEDPSRTQRLVDQADQVGRISDEGERRRPTLDCHRRSDARCHDERHQVPSAGAGPLQGGHHVATRVGHGLHASILTRAARPFGT